MTDRRDNDAVWARFYRDGKSLGEIAAEFGGTVHDYSPWLYAPITRTVDQALSQTSLGPGNVFPPDRLSDAIASMNEGDMLTIDADGTAHVHRGRQGWGQKPVAGSEGPERTDTFDVQLNKRVIDIRDHEI